MNRSTQRGWAGAVAITFWGVLYRLGRTWGSTRKERARNLPGDEIVAQPRLVTNHAVTIHASAEEIWPWLIQVGVAPSRLVHVSLGRPDPVPR